MIISNVELIGDEPHPLLGAGVDVLNRQIDKFNEWSDIGYNGPKFLAGMAGGLALTAVVAERAALRLHKRETTIPSVLGQAGLHIVAAGAALGAACFREVFVDELNALDPGC